MLPKTPQTPEQNSIKCVCGGGGVGKEKEREILQKKKKSVFCLTTCH